jgi:hypothetical protein
MVDVLLESADISRVLLARHQTGDTSDPPSTVDLVRRISELAAGGGAPAAAVATVAPAPALASIAPAPVLEAPTVVAAPAPVASTVAAPAPTAPSGQRELEVRMGPLDRPELADGIKDLFRDITGLGEISELPSQQADFRVFKVLTTSSEDDLLDLFVFHVSREQVHILQDSAPSVWLFEAQYAERVQDICASLTTLPTLICIGVPTHTLTHAYNDYEQLVSQAATTRPALSAREHDTIFLVYTSGTTGQPKGVMHSHHGQLEQTKNCSNIFAANPQDCALLVMPFYHLGAISIYLSYAWAGGAVAVHRAFDASQVLLALSQQRITAALAGFSFESAQRCTHQ